MTGLCEAIYFVSLSAAYRSGDLTIAYPLARAAPVIIVTLVSFLFGQGGQISNQCIAGIILISAAVSFYPFIISLISVLKIISILPAFLPFAPALGTVGYSMIDFKALQLLRETPDINLGAVGIGISYVAIEFFIAALWLVLITVTNKRGRNDLRQVFHNSLRPAVLTGVSFLVPYSLVLIAMAHVTNVSYVVAFRQVSIPLGVIFGVIFLKEPRFYPKFIGTLIIFIGLVFVAFG